MAAEFGSKVVVITGAKSGGEAIPFACDVTQFDDMAALAQAAKQRFGQLDVWGNDAGVHMPGRFDDLPLEDFRVHGCRAARCDRCRRSIRPRNSADIIVALAAKPEREVFMGISRLITIMCDQTKSPPSTDGGLFYVASSPYRLPWTHS